jgi:hypothetical protein
VVERLLVVKHNVHVALRMLQHVAQHRPAARRGVEESKAQAACKQCK